MQSETIGEVEKLLRTEMADLEKFYEEFGESSSLRGPRSLGKSGGGEQGVASPRNAPQVRESWSDPLRHSTRFMKSGDFFEYIENMVEQDSQGKEPLVSSSREVNPVLEEFREDQFDINPNLDMSQARNLDVEMNVQSTFIETVKKRERSKERQMEREREVMQNREVIPEMPEPPENDEPVRSQVRVETNEPSWRRSNEFTKSIDERVITSKKKTFEEMLEEALKKEGHSEVEQPPPQENVPRRNTNFLKKNTSRRRFLNKKTKAKSRYGRANFKKKKTKPKKEEVKDMTESMLEFEKMEQINGQKSQEEEKDFEKNEVASIEEKSEEVSEEEIDYHFLKMGEGKENEEGNGERLSQVHLKTEVARVKKEVEAKFKRKIEELNKEIRKYKNKNKTLEEDKKKVMKLKKKVEEDKLLVDKLKADRADFENYKQKELEKIKREKALTKRNAKAYRATANKKDKETIDNLKKEMRVIRDQASTKEKKLKDALERRKRIIEELKGENEELRGQVDFYEKMRMGKSKKKEKGKAKKKEEESDEESEEGESEEESESEEEENVKSLKTAVDKLSKKKAKKGEVKKFLGEFYEGFENPIPNVNKGTLKINNENYKFDENTHFKKYKWNRENDLKVVQEEESEGKVYKTFADGRKEIKFSNGAVKEIMPDGYIIGRKLTEVHFVNSDIKQTLPDGTVIYFYSEHETTQITLPNNNLDIYRFPNAQVEFHFKNGNKQIKFQDGTEKFVYKNGEEFTVYADNTLQLVNKEGVKVIKHSDSNQEIVLQDGQKISTKEN